MALIEMGVIVTKIRGKARGAVFTGNNSGNTIQNLRLPYKHKKPSGFTVNTNQQYFMQQWPLIGTIEQGNWAGYSGNFTFYNKLGAAVAANPAFVFATTNSFIYQMSYGILTSPPTYTFPSTPAYIRLVIEPLATRAYVTFPVDLDTTIIFLSFSPPFQLGKASFFTKRTKQYFVIGLSSVSSTTIDFQSTFYTLYPWAIAGQQCIVSWRYVNLDSGVWSPKFSNIVDLT